MQTETSKYDFPGFLLRSDAASSRIQTMRGEMFSTLLLPSLQVWRHLCGPETAANPLGICIPLSYIRPTSFAPKNLFFFYSHFLGYVRYTWRKKQPRWGCQCRERARHYLRGKKPPLSPALRKTELQGTKRSLKQASASGNVQGIQVGLQSLDLWGKALEFSVFRSPLA